MAQSGETKWVIVAGIPNIGNAGETVWNIVAGIPNAYSAGTSVSVSANVIDLELTTNDPTTIRDADVIIGSTGSYATISEWTESLSAFNGIRIGRCLGEVFNEDVTIVNQTTTSSSYIHLTSVSGDEHDGISYVVGTSASAKITGKIDISDSYFELSWLEIDGPASRNFPSISIHDCDSGWVKIHHNIIHNDGRSTSADQHGIVVDSINTNCYLYRNIVYGHGGYGILLSAGNDCAAYHNTVFNCNMTSATGDYAGLSNLISSAKIKYNASFDNFNKDYS